MTDPIQFFRKPIKKEGKTTKKTPVKDAFLSLMKKYQIHNDAEKIEINQSQSPLTLLYDYLLQKKAIGDLPFEIEGIKDQGMISILDLDSRGKIILQTEDWTQSIQHKGYYTNKIELSEIIHHQQDKIIYSKDALNLDINFIFHKSIFDSLFPFINEITYNYAWSVIFNEETWIDPENKEEFAILIRTEPILSILERELYEMFQDSTKIEADIKDLINGINRTITLITEIVQKLVPFDDETEETEKK